MSGGGLLQYASLQDVLRLPEQNPVLITGGAGFIGTNLADRLANAGQRVLLYDNLSRAGVEKNLLWLSRKHGELVEFRRGDTRDVASVKQVVQRASAVFHFAAQVAVTDSLADPVKDFEVNARGTLNVLEAIRTSSTQPPIIFTSTNKVYGDLPHVDVVERSSRYDPADPELAANGVSERMPLSFHSPYGCSKGTADQYVLDYARCFGLRAVVFRMSCIYGPHQFGTEDQGWVAHFLIRALSDEAITLYGDGKQVRDLLFADDLVDAFLLAREHIDSLSAQAFNIGGGPRNAVSLLELLKMMAEINGEKPEVAFNEWRTGDQRYYVSDTSKFRAATGWAPRIGVDSGVRRLREWLLAASESPVRVAAGLRRAAR
jgi:CDP-paratose 2-epimerase